MSIEDTLKKFRKRCPALAALSKINNPKPDCLRACILELFRLVGCLQVENAWAEPPGYMWWIKLDAQSPHDNERCFVYREPNIFTVANWNDNKKHFVTTDGYVVVGVLHWARISAPDAHGEE
jgi:hypothetical protein